ncbi:MAG: DUF3991 domain-containing protein [Silvanigrellaceae bacterium]|nr:DUF3991 domain-containing protein [Silvanigrellaceae bacterium]
MQVKYPFLKGKKSFSGFKWRQNEVTGLEGHLQNTINEILKQKNISAPEFAKRLEDFGINVRANLSSTGKMNGFSFEYNGISFKGQDLGQKYKWSELQKRGVSYEQTRDCEKLKQFTKDFSECNISTRTDREHAIGIGKLSRELERGTERNHFTDSEFEGRSQENFGSLQQDQRESEKYTERIIAIHDRKIIGDVQPENRGSSINSKEFEDQYRKVFQNVESLGRSKSDVFSNEEIYRNKHRESEQYISTDDKRNIQNKRGTTQQILENVRNHSRDNNTINITNNDFLSTSEKTILNGSDNKTITRSRYDSKESNEKRNVVDKSNIRTSRELDPSDCLRSMGFEVKKDGQNHLSVELNGDQIYRVTKKQDGHYVSCDKYGNGIGDNIALIQDIRPDLKFAEAVYKLHAYDLNYKFENKNTTQEIDKKIDLKIPRQVENERKLGREYLHEKRGISFDTINHAEKVGLIKYSDKGVLFVGYDENQNVKNITQRSIRESNAIQKIDYRGSDKQYCQLLQGNNKSIWIVEGGIDALALRDLALRQKEDSPTILISGGANVKSFLERDSIQNLLKDANRVTIAVEKEKIMKPKLK